MTEHAWCGVKGSFLVSLRVTWKDTVAMFVLFSVQSVPSASHSKRNVCMCAAAFCVTWIGNHSNFVFQLNFILNKLTCLVAKKQKSPASYFSVSLHEWVIFCNIS